MFYSHHFAHRETLTRAHSWLTELGFNAKKVENPESGIPRLILSVDRHRIDAVRLLINAAEYDDPDGFPCFWHEARMPHANVVGGLAEKTPADRPLTQSTVIGWHPLAD
jgi:hypothetical protein